MDCKLFLFMLGMKNILLCMCFKVFWKDWVKIFLFLVLMVICIVFLRFFRFLWFFRKFVMYGCEVGIIFLKLVLGWIFIVWNVMKIVINVNNVNKVVLWLKKKCLRICFEEWMEFFIKCEDILVVFCYLNILGFY